MARLRTLKPGFFTNDELAECPALARLLFAGLWTIADREGRLQDRPKRIKAEVLPYDDVDADALLEQLAERGFLVRYAVDGERYIQIVNFLKHQNPHVKEPPSLLPPPPGLPTPGPAPEAPDPDDAGEPDEHQTSTGQEQCSPGSGRAGLVFGLGNGLVSGLGSGTTAPDGAAPAPLMMVHPPKAHPKTAHRLMVDALAEHFWTPDSDPEWKRFQAVAKALLQAKPPVMPEELPSLVEGYRQVMPRDSKPTPPAVLSNLGRIRTALRDGGGRVPDSLYALRNVAQRRIAQEESA